MMKSFALTSALCFTAHQTAMGFSPMQHLSSTMPGSRLHLATDSLIEMAEIDAAKTSLLKTTERLKTGYGVLIVDEKAKTQLMEAVDALEKAAGPANTDTDTLKGSWTLVSSTATATIMNDKTIPGIDSSKIPFFNQGLLLDIRKQINQSLTVKQDIKSVKTMGAIDRVDHIIEYMPPSKLTDIISSFEIPEVLKSLNLNPLQVKESKFILAHDAEVTSIIPTIKTKLSLASIVLNVAGTSQMLDPSGADVISTNVPLGEFLNAGTFETTYLSDDLRVSRSKTGSLDQLRVFVRTAVPETEMTRTTPEGEPPAPMASTPIDAIDDVSDDGDDDYADDSSPSDVESS